MKPILAFTALLLSSLAVCAQQLNVGKPTFGGTACPKQNTELVIDNYNKFMYLFDTHQVDGSAPANFARATCQIRVPVSAPLGQKMVVRSVVTEGVYNVENGDSAQVDQDIWFVGQRLRKPSKIELSGEWDYLELGKNLSDNVLAESKCDGKDTMLALSLTSLIRKSSRAPTESFIGLHKLEFKISLEPCDADGKKRVRPTNPPKAD
jgi:hypothetical protein